MLSQTFVSFVIHCVYTITKFGYFTHSNQKPSLIFFDSTLRVPFWLPVLNKLILQKVQTSTFYIKLSQFRQGSSLLKGAGSLAIAQRCRGGDIYKKGRFQLNRSQYPIPSASRGCAPWTFPAGSQTVDTEFCCNIHWRLRKQKLSSQELKTQQIENLEFFVFFTRTSSILVDLTPSNNIVSPELELKLMRHCFDGKYLKQSKNTKS